MDPFIRHQISSIKPFDIYSLESGAITKLFEEVSSYVQDIRIEMISYPVRICGAEDNPAVLIGVRQKKTAIQFIDTLDQRQRVEAIAHELAHLLMIYRYGLSLVDHRPPCPKAISQMSEDEIGREKNWFFFLGQMTNTVHHLILVPYLKEIYGIESGLHLQLLKRSCISSDDLNDLELQHNGGLIAYEYERLIGERNPWINFYSQSGNFQRTFESAHKHFREYCLLTIPSPPLHKKNILSFLEDLGYPAGEFIFFPRKMNHSRLDVNKKKQKVDFFLST
jgi:hypothetical protein